MQNTQSPTLESKYLINTRKAPKTGFVEKNDLYEFFINNQSTPIDKWEHYFQIYEKHFSRFRNKEINILEIGVYKGGSLKLWQKYFGDKVNIYAVDIDPATKAYEKDNIKIFIGDQADPVFLNKIKEEMPPLDIIIDDGGHTTKQQIVSFIELYEKVSTNGVYFVEDLSTNYSSSFVDTENKDTFVNFAKRHIDSLNSWYFPGDQMYHRYNKPAEQRSGDLVVPEFSLVTHSICFYNQIIVFEKQEMHEPYTLITGKE